MTYFSCTLPWIKEKQACPICVWAHVGRWTITKAALTEENKSKGTHDLEICRSSLCKSSQPHCTFNQLHRITVQRKKNVAQLWQLTFKIWLRHSHDCLRQLHVLCVDMCVYVLITILVWALQSEKQRHTFVFDYIIYLSEGSRPTQTLPQPPIWRESLYTQMPIFAFTRSGKQNYLCQCK